MAVLQGSGEFQGKVFPLDEQDCNVGRAEGQSIQIVHGSVSGRHAKLWCEERWFVQDVGSRNGTSINGTPIASDEAYELRDGDEIGFGGVKLRFDPSVPGGALAEVRKVLETVQAAFDQLTGEYGELRQKLKNVEVDLKDREEALDEWERRMHEVNANWLSREDLAEQLKAADERARADAQRQIDAAVRRALEMEKRYVQATSRVETLERSLREKEDELLRRQG